MNYSPNRTKIIIKKKTKTAATLSKATWPHLSHVVPLVDLDIWYNLHIFFGESQAFSRAQSDRRFSEALCQRSWFVIQRWRVINWAVGIGFLKVRCWSDSDQRQWHWKLRTWKCLKRNQPYLITECSMFIHAVKIRPWYKLTLNTTK